MVYLFLNTDEYLTAQRIAELRRALGDPETADLNAVTIEGYKSSSRDILGQASMMPFLAPRRLIVVVGYLSYLQRRMSQSQGDDSAAHDEAADLLLHLDDVPPESDLVFIDTDYRRTGQLWRGFKRAAKDGSEESIPGLSDLSKQCVATAEEISTPDARALPGWINHRARDIGAHIDGQAVQLLANFVGPNLRQLDNELQKLGTYAAGRSITEADVNLLVRDASEAMIWDLTDALSQRNSRKAMVTLHALRRADANAFYLLTMIARQYRIVLKVKDAMSTMGLANEHDIAKVVGEKPYPVKQAMKQSRAYSMERLEAIVERMLEADFAMKTGADPDTEIEVLIAELTIRQPQGHR